MGKNGSPARPERDFCSTMGRTVPMAIKDPDSSQSLIARYLAPSQSATTWGIHCYRIHCPAEASSREADVEAARVWKGGWGLVLNRSQCFPRATLMISVIVPSPISDTSPNRGSPMRSTYGFEIAKVILNSTYQPRSISTYSVSRLDQATSQRRHPRRTITEVYRV